MKLFNVEVPKGDLSEAQLTMLGSARDEHWVNVRNFFENVDHDVLKAMKEDATRVIRTGGQLHVYAAAIFISTVIDEVRFRKHRQLVGRI